MNAQVLESLEEARQRRATVRALGLSLLLHSLMIAAAGFLLQIRPPLALPLEEKPTVELTLVEPLPPHQVASPSYLATTEAQRADSPPEQANFESDKDTRAASELPAQGDLPLPTQEGEELPTAQFENREYTAGHQAGESTPPAPQSAPMPPEPQFRTGAEDRPAAPASEIALLEPVRPQPMPPPAESAAAVARPRTSAAFQPQTRVTRLRGSITNRGRAAADAAATPLGAYKKQISDAIGSRWYYYVNQAVGLLNPGTVEIRFVVRPGGEVEQVQVLRNSSNESFASTSVRAIMDAEIPPIPEDVRPMLHNESIEVEFTFTILSR